MEHNSNDWNKLFKPYVEDDFWKNFNNIFNRSEQQVRVNLYESGHELLCIIFLPGIKKVEDIDLYVNGSTLEVSGNINLEYNEYRIIQEEVFQGIFKRVIELPFLVRKDKIVASYKRGLLSILLYRQVANNRKNQRGIVIRDEE